MVRRQLLDLSTSLIKYVLSSAERRKSRELRRLRNVPRYQATTTDLLDSKTRVVDGPSFISAYHQIFEREIYRFRSGRLDPLILDCGANIGLATAYWKTLYPKARIIAFEPDPRIFEALQANCRRWQLDDVKLVNCALSDHVGEMAFEVEGGDAGRLLSGKSIDNSEMSHRETITVPTMRLRDYLQDPIDLIKLDIEGAEVDVLLDCADRLTMARHLFVEYHSLLTKKQRLHELLEVLSVSGFRIHIQPELVSPSPFTVRLQDHGMDQRLNVFAYREDLDPPH